MLLSRFSLVSRLSHSSPGLKIDDEHIAVPYVMKMLVMLEEVVVDAQSSFPLPFVPFLAHFLKYFANNVISLAPRCDYEHGRVYAGESSVLLESLRHVICSSLQFLKNVVLCLQYRAEELVSHDEPLMQQGTRTRAEFFNQETVTMLVREK